MSINKEYSFSAGTITIVGENILLMKFNSSISIGIDVMIESAELRKKIIGDQAYFPIVDMREGFVNFSKEAKRWAAEDRYYANFRIIDILLVANWGMKMEAKLYHKIFKPLNKTKIVMSMDEAFKVIEDHKESYSKGEKSA